MFDAKIVLDDGSFYQTKVSVIPQQGELIYLESFSDLTSNQDPYLHLKVSSVVHNLVEFSDKHTVVKEHYHTITINVFKNY